MSGLSAKFVADFSSFYDAVGQADVKLKTLGDGANTVGQRLTTMVEKFSGRKLIQDATLMAEAVERVGGVANLTAIDLQRVATATGLAVEQLQRLGGPIPEGLAKIAAEAKNASESFTGKFAKGLSTINDLLGGFGAALSVGAVVSFGKAIADDADALVKMSDRTAIGVESLQRLKAIAEPSGNTIDQVADAVNKFQKNVATGTPATVSALDAIGLSISGIRALAPDEQFIAIAKGIAQIKDPAEQVRLAVELFGRAGADLLPTLKSDVDTLKDSTLVMSERSVKAWDEAGDAANRYWQNLKAGTGEAIGQLLALTQTTDAQFEHQKAAYKANSAAGRALARQQGLTTGPEQDLSGTIGAQTIPSHTDEAGRLVADARAASGAFDMSAQIAATDAALKRSNETAITDASASLDTFTKQAKADADFIAKVKAENDKVLAATFVGPAPFLDSKAIAPYYLLERATGGLNEDMTKLDATASNLSIGFMHTGASTLTLAKQADTVGVHIKAGLTDTLAGVPQTMVNALTGGGSVMGAIEGIGSQAGAAVGKSIGATIGGLAGLAGPLGAAVGSMIGPAIDMIGKLFGSAEKQINPVRQAFVDAAGGLGALNEQAAAAGVTLGKMLDAKNPEAYKKAIDDLNAAFAFQDAAMKTLDDTTKKYGFTIGELGPALEKQNLDKQAQGLYQDWQVLNAAGIDTVAITTRMSDSVNAYVQSAVAMGQDVPEAMRPMLEKMVEAGQLTDANGDKIDDLNDAGITFAKTMSQQFDTLIGSVDKLTAAISRGLGVAVDDTTEKIKKIPTKVGVDIEYHDPGPGARPGATLVPASAGGGDLEAYQHGTDGFRNFGAGTPVMLHGWEAVVPRDQASHPGALPGLLPGGGEAAGGGDMYVVTIDARGALFNDPGSDQRLADRIEQALNAKHGLTHKRRAA